MPRSVGFDSYRVSSPAIAGLEFLTGFTSKYIVFGGQAFRPAYCKAPAAGPGPTKCKLFCALGNKYIQ